MTSSGVFPYLGSSGWYRRWFGSSTYGCEFERIPYAAFLPVLEDESFRFLEEDEKLPYGYNPGDIVL